MSESRSVTTTGETAVLGHLAAAWKAFVALNAAAPSHPDDEFDFRKGINSCQSVIAHRVACRVDPQTWSNDAPANPVPSHQPASLGPVAA